MIVRRAAHPAACLALVGIAVSAGALAREFRTSCDPVQCGHLGRAQLHLELQNNRPLSIQNHHLSGAILHASAFSIERFEREEVEASR